MTFYLGKKREKIMVRNGKRNKKIVNDYRNGKTIQELSVKYRLSNSGIYAILRLELSKDEINYLKKKSKKSKPIEESKNKPRRATLYSAWYDFTAPRDILVKSHETAYFDSETKVNIDRDKVMLLFIRSSLGIKNKITLLNNVGVIDADYKDTIKVAVKNDSNNDYIIKKGDRYMQGVIVKYYLMDDDEPMLEKRDGGIGSTNGNK